LWASLPKTVRNHDPDAEADLLWVEKRVRELARELGRLEGPGGQRRLGERMRELIVSM